MRTVGVGVGDYGQRRATRRLIIGGEKRDIRDLPARHTHHGSTTHGGGFVFIDIGDPRSVASALGHVLVLEFDRHNALAFLDGINTSLTEHLPDKPELALSVEALCEGIRSGVRQTLAQSGSGEATIRLDERLANLLSRFVGLVVDGTEMLEIGPNDYRELLIELNEYHHASSPLLADNDWAVTDATSRAVLGMMHDSMIKSYGELEWDRNFEAYHHHDEDLL